MFLTLWLEPICWLASVALVFAQQSAFAGPWQLTERIELAGEPVDEKNPCD